MPADLAEAIQAVQSGSTICFLGAGFSIAGHDAEGKELPTSRQLAREIHELIQLPYDENSSLSDLAEFCEADARFAQKLPALLIKRLTVTRPSPPQKKILTAPWRAIFTSNFDDLVERALPAQSIQVVTPNVDTAVIDTARTPVYYLHGRALDILERRVDPRIVISESNYLDIKENNASLYSIFLNEMHCASAIFFIGYSIKDLDIARRLFFASDALKSKSFVITGPDEGQVAVQRLAKFGEVCPIGVSAFADLFPSSFIRKQSAPSIPSLSFLRHKKATPPATNVDAEDSLRLVISGEFDYSKYASQKQQGSGGDPYCISRDERIQEIFTGISNKINRFVVSADIGNGKTVFLDQLEYAAHQQGYQVFRIETRLQELFSELDVILALPQRQIFLVDDIVRNREVVQYIGGRLSGLGVLVCATRDVLDSQRFDEVTRWLGGATREINLDVLTDAELNSWEGLLERWGLWEERAGLDRFARMQFLKLECSSENRAIIVSVFRSTAVARKIDAIVSYFLNTNPQHMRAFVAVLICSLCQKHVDWGRVVQWLAIDEQRLKSDIEKQAVFNFMLGRRDWYKFTSSQLADHIFRNFEFDEETIVDVYTRIVRETAFAANDQRSGFDSRENLKELMKFRFLTRLFGEKSAALASIGAIYRRLSAAPRIRDNDQFWLQYAMSCLEVENVVEAETYIKTALGLANRKGMNYSNHQILDQRVRLFFLKNALAKKFDVSEITTALGDLEVLVQRGSIDIIYPLRSARYVLRFIEKHIDEIKLDMSARLLALLNVMEGKLGTGNLPKSKRGESDSLRRAVFEAKLIIANS